MKMYRRGRVVADQPGMTVQLRLIDDDTYKFRNPQYLNSALDSSGKFSINRKMKRVSVQMNWPIQDESLNVLELQMSFIPGADR
jgi:hypothetical protein